MPIIHIANSEQEARENGSNPRKCEGFGDNAFWLYDTHVGLCIKEFEVNGYDDSDFNMIVWNIEKNCPETICFATTRGWTYPCYGSSPDATPEIMDKYNAYLEKKAIERKEEFDTLNIAIPENGKNVIVVSGKKHKNKTGRIFWRGVNRFRTYYRNGYNRPDHGCNQILGIETSEGEKFFVPAQQACVVGCNINCADAIDDLRTFYKIESYVRY